MSNLSAVKYELGDYRTAALFARKAISLNQGATAPANQDRLYTRIAKCSLLLFDLEVADKAILEIADGTVKTELQSSADSLKQVAIKFPDQARLRKTILQQLPRYKSSL